MPSSIAGIVAQHHRVDADGATNPVAIVQLADRITRASLAEVR
jgi:hypothetical protein